MNTKIKLLSALVGLRMELQRFQRGGLVHYFLPDLGICNNLTRYLSLVDGYVCEDLLTLFMDLMEEWPEFSGDRSYPVPHPSESPDRAFVLAPTGDMWSPESAYGAARLRLLDWLIARLEAETEAETKAELGTKGETK